jgi:hypothetical protein
MNNATANGDIVEQSLRKILKKNGMGGIIFLIALGVLLIGIVIVGFVLGLAEYVGYLQAVIFILLGVSLTGIGVHKLKKRGQLKNDLYSSLIVCGTSEEPGAVAAAFNREYESSPKDPVLENAGLFITEHYVMTRGNDVGIAPHDAVLVAMQQGRPRNSVSDDITIVIHCHYQPGIKCNSLPGVRVFGKPGTALVQAIEKRGYPIYFIDMQRDADLLALLPNKYQEFERIIKARLAQ